MSVSPEVAEITKKILGILDGKDQRDVMSVLLNLSAFSLCQMSATLKDALHNANEISDQTQTLIEQNWTKVAAQRALLNTLD